MHHAEEYLCENTIEQIIWHSSESKIKVDSALRCSTLLLIHTSIKFSKYESINSIHSFQIFSSFWISALLGAGPLLPWFLPCASGIHGHLAEVFKSDVSGWDQAGLSLVCCLQDCKLSKKNNRGFGLKAKILFQAVCPAPMLKVYTCYKQLLSIRYPQRAWETPILSPHKWTTWAQACWGQKVPTSWLSWLSPKLEWQAAPAFGGQP